MKPSAPSARLAASQLLTTILRDRRTCDEALLKTPLPSNDADSKFAVALTLTVLRHLGQLDATIATYLQKPLPAKRLSVQNALRLGAAQLLLMDTARHAAVNETVGLLKKGPDAALRGLVNALLQTIARERPPLPSPTTNLPPHVKTRWEREYGADVTAQIAAQAVRRPPLDINSTAPNDSATRLDSQMLRLPEVHAPVDTLPGYSEGTFFVQDLAASYPARLLGNVNGASVLDICAAPGGKTMQLARNGAHVTALDISETRMTRLRENLTRTHSRATLVTANMMDWQPDAPFDAILLDAPCTATGTWRRHPEVVHLVTDAQITERAALQQAMLERAWQWLKPGGKLVYCVCSLEPEEGEAQAHRFLKTMPDAALHPADTGTEIPAHCISPQGYLRTRPDMLADQGGMDGFFAACFIKKAA